jgi:small subunit ribosomal protein S14
MASQRMIRREKKRERLTELFAEERKKLVEQLKNPALDVAKKFDILARLEKMPRDASRVRRMRRCAETGRSRGCLRKFGLARTEVRRRAMLGEIPGLVKSSW